MPLRGEDYAPGTPIYSFVARDGKNTHIDSEKLRLWCKENRERLEVVNTPVSEKMANSFVDENVVDIAHVVRVMMMRKLDPVIYCKDGGGTRDRPDVMLVDGHHRYVAAAVHNLRMIPAYVLEPEQWRDFEIIGLPDMTEEELRAAPVCKKERTA